MFYYFIIFELLFFLIINYFISKKKLNLFSIFCIVWLIITFLAHMELFNMVHVSDYIYEIVFIGCLGMGVGYVSFYILKNKKIKNTNTSFNFNAFKIVTFLCFCFYLYTSINVLLLLFQHTPYAIIRSMYQGYYGYNALSIFHSELLRSIDIYIMHPYLFVLAPILVLSFFEKVIPRKWQIVSAASIIMYLFSSASRFLLLYVIVELLFCILYYQKDMLKKYKKRITKIALFLIFLIFLITYIRTRTVMNGQYTIFQNLYAYFTVEFPLMDYWIKKSADFSSYGMSFFHGIVGVILKIFGLNFNFYADVTNNVVLTETMFVSVFPWKKYNAFVSMFYFFYLDFKLPGVFLGTLVFGAICAIVNKNFNNSQNLKYKVIFLLFLQNVVTSFIRWQFFNLNMVVAFIWVFILFLKIRVK